MPPCKGHRKSRNGCQVCKKRRIKCDETRPVCKNCFRHGSSCIYDNSIQVHPSADPSSSSLSVPSTGTNCQTCGLTHTHQTRFPWLTDFPGALPACTIPNLLRKTTFNLPFSIISPSAFSLSTIDLSLLHHFTISTSQTFSPLAEIKDLWSRIVPGPEIGARWNFVLHACLAVAGAHLNSSNPNFEGLAMAEHHYKAAITLMKEQTRQINEANCHALFVAASACNVFLLARRLQQSPSSSQSVVARCSEAPSTELDVSWTLLIRGTFGILQQSWPWILKGPVAPLVRPYPVPSMTATRKLTKNTDEMMKKMNSLAAEWGFGLDGDEEELGDVETATAYFVAVWNLRRIWVVLEYCLGASHCKVDSPATATIDDEYESDSHSEREFPRRKCRESYRPDSLSSSIFQFVIRTPPRFWECLEKKRPRALIIYAYFAVCWEALNYGSEMLVDVVGCRKNSRSLHAGDNVMWWAKGRAEMDLQAIEGELLRLDSSGALWKEWMEGARRCHDGLKRGWWFDEQVSSIDLFQNSNTGHQPRTTSQEDSDDCQIPPEVISEPFGFTFDLSFNEGWIGDVQGSSFNFGIDMESVTSLNGPGFFWDGT